MLYDEQLRNNTRSWGNSKVDRIKWSHLLHTSQSPMPLTELPKESKGGDQEQTPITLGITNIIAPQTPDFAGNPTY